jgi:cystathionine beta-lyase/cystathionine gamma-synthase
MPVEKMKATPIGGYHGVTVELPTLETNIQYEEGTIELDRGYIRFVLHPDVSNLQNQKSAEFHACGALALNSPESALFLLMDALFAPGGRGWYLSGELPEKMFGLLQQTAGPIAALTSADAADTILLDLSEPIKKIDFQNKTVVGFDPQGKWRSESAEVPFKAVVTADRENAVGYILFYDPPLLDDVKLRRRHTGYNLSSRKAERILKKQSAGISADFDSLKLKLALLEKGEPENVFLFPSGMGAISAAILANLTPERPKLIMLGSPYVDTRAILEKWPLRRGTPENIFLEVDDLPRLEQALDDQTALVICEIPTNPLVRVPDLAPIVALTHAKGAQVLVDNTIASPFNFNPFDYEVDLIAHSTTKSLNGRNDHLGGVLLARNAATRAKVQTFVEQLKLSMDPADARVLNQNLDGFHRRMKKMNENAGKLAEYLQNHPQVKQVYYPGLPTHPDHAIAQKYLRGFGSLLSFLLEGDLEKNTQIFYDALGAPFAKGPTIGSEQSLACLYVILAHYFDSPEKLAQMGLNKYLVRVTVGVEDSAEIIRAVELALAQI